MALNSFGSTLSDFSNNMPDDIIEEILLHLPLTSLARSKSLSKEWCDFISHNMTFRERYLCRNRGKSFLLLGFFFCNVYPLGSPEPVGFLPTSTEGKCMKISLKKRKRNSASASASAAAAAAASNFSFPLPLDQSLSFLGVYSVCLWGSSNGFLLSSLEHLKPMNYTICNPITKEGFGLPPPNFPCWSLNHGFICNATDHKVVRVIQRGMPEFSANTLIIEMFSSELPEQWKLSVHTFSFSFHVLPFPSVITEQGVIYFPVTLENRHNALIIFDPTHKECMEVWSFPAQSGTYFGFKYECLGQSDGVILYARYESGEVKVWELNESSDGDITARKWCLKHKSRLNMTGGKYRYKGGFYFIGFHPMNPQVLFIGTDHNIFVFDVGCSKLELVCDFAEQNLKSGYTYFPYSYTVIGPHMFCQR